MQPIPLLILGDSPAGNTGLGRICRDLATRIAMNMQDVFDVAVLGLGAVASRHLPFFQYNQRDAENFMPHELPKVWMDFAGIRRGILFPIWDVSRLFWLADPQICPSLYMRGFLESNPFQKWVYPAVDAEGPNRELSVKLRMALEKFDRVINYTAWSARITGYPDHLPHGIDTSVFYPQDRKMCRERLRGGGFEQLKEDSLLLGCVATNQPRKQWPLAFKVTRELLNRGEDVYLWVHTDEMVRHWDLYASIIDYGLQQRCILNSQTALTDNDLALMYSACDFTIGIGPEGFGYPLAESLACGTPVVAGSCGGQADFVPYLVEPKWYQEEGAFNSSRPVYDHADYAEKIQKWKGVDYNGKSLLPAELDWDNLWPRWEEWLRKGVADGTDPVQTPVLSHAEESH